VKFPFHPFVKNSVSELIVSLFYRFIVLSFHRFTPARWTAAASLASGSRSRYDPGAFSSSVKIRSNTLTVPILSNAFKENRRDLRERSSMYFTHYRGSDTRWIF